MPVPSEKLLEKLDTHHLPSLDRVLVEAISACNQDCSTYDRVAQIIKQDPALTVKILTVVNSSILSPVRPLANIELALVTLGIEMVKAIAITTSRHILGSVNLDEVIDLERFWHHSLRCGVMARILAKSIGYQSVDDAYMAGLLHNVGELVIASNFSSEYNSSHAVYGFELLMQERKQFGFNRCDAGAWLVDQWKLRSVVAEAISSQQDPVEEICKADALVKIIFLASQLVPGAFNQDIDVYAIANRMFGLNNETLDKIISETDCEVSAIADSMSIDLQSRRPSDVGFNVDSVYSEDLRTGLDVNGELSSLVHDQTRIDTIRLLIVSAETNDELVNIIQVSAYVLFGYKQVVLFLPNDEASVLVGTVAGRKRYKGGLVAVNCQDNSSAIAQCFRQKIEVQSVFAKPDHSSSLVDRRVARLCGTDRIQCLPVCDNDEVFGVLVVGVREYNLASAASHSKMLQEFCHIAGVAFARIRKQINTDHAVMLGQGLKPDRVRSLVHEVSNPLCILKNYIDILDSKSEGAHREELNIIGTEIDRIGRIIAQISDDSDQHKERNESISINGIIKDLISLFQESYFIPNRVRIIFKPSEEVGNIAVYSDALKQVLVNLLKNSTESIIDSGKIKITTKANVMVQAKQYTEIVVADTGRGIPQDVMAKLFSPKISAKGKRRGIGLFIVKNLVTEMGGLIHCKTQVGKGTSFQVLLPEF